MLNKDIRGRALSPSIMLVHFLSCCTNCFFSDQFYFRLNNELFRLIKELPESWVLVLLRNILTFLTIMFVNRVSAFWMLNFICF